jgi:fructose-bisphosphate aldolase class I
MDGRHSLAQHYEATEATLRMLFGELAEHRVHLEGLLLKVNMVLSGTTCPEQATVAEAAQATCRCMRRTVPPAVQGIVFLSGGQSDVRATEHLDALNRIGHAPWELSFSFGRALQAPALKVWQGVAENTAAAQVALLRRASCNSAARFGQYTAEMEKEAKVV